jgi:hypothetical protein
VDISNIGSTQLTSLHLDVGENNAYITDKKQLEDEPKKFNSVLRLCPQLESFTIQGYIDGDDCDGGSLNLDFSHLEKLTNFSVNLGCGSKYYKLNVPERKISFGKI